MMPVGIRSFAVMRARFSLSYGLSVRSLRAVPLLLLATAACSSHTMLLESDVPLPRGMSSARSGDIRRTSGTVSAGRFLLSGEVNDANGTINDAVAAYLASGWRLVERTGGLDRAGAVFTKDTRTVSLTLYRRAVEPDMSSGMLLISDAATRAPITPAASTTTPAASDATSASASTTTTH
jgi:hypothetical protein